MSHTIESVHFQRLEEFFFGGEVAVRPIAPPARSSRAGSTCAARARLSANRAGARRRRTRASLRHESTALALARVAHASARVSRSVAEEFIESFEKWAQPHVALFDDEALTGGEQKLEFMQVYTVRCTVARDAARAAPASSRFARATLSRRGPLYALCLPCAPPAVKRRSRARAHGRRVALRFCQAFIELVRGRRTAVHPS